jgi:hypothetical protein
LGFRFRVEVNFNYASQHYSQLLLWVLGKSEVKQDITDDGVAISYLNEILPQHLPILQNDPNFTIFDVEDHNPNKTENG